MDIIAAALIAVGLVIAAVVYAGVGRTHRGSGPPTPVSNQAARVTALEAELPERRAALARREEAIAKREAEVQRELEGLSAKREDLQLELERISGLSAARAKQLLLDQVEEQAKHDAARRIRQIEEETKREADRRVRNILSVCMQRLAAGHAAETTVSVVQ
ncbi:MAG: DUF3552 domain-containing protein, partial [Solirubrobacterales bacterium]|nr:DUF3552 domain-containing protein [Solirubrobacterales bacterium]